MSVSNIISSIRIIQKPMVERCFRNVILHRTSPRAGAALSPSPQLVLLFTWVGAKDSVSQKFINAWSRRGFNVLHVNTPILDLLRPKNGTEVTASRVVDYLAENDEYNLTIHGLSVGGYMGQRVLKGLTSTDVVKRVTHQVYDSFSNIDGLQQGVGHAVNPRYKDVVTSIGDLYSRYGNLSYFEAIVKFMSDVPSPSPILFMHSLADKVSKYESVSWVLPLQAKRQPLYAFEIPEEENVSHVNLFRHMGEQAYMSCITRFLRSNNFNVSQPSILDEEDSTSYQAQLNIQRTRLFKPDKS